MKSVSNFIAKDLFNEEITVLKNQKDGKVSI